MNSALFPATTKYVSMNGPDSGELNVVYDMNAFSLFAFSDSFIKRSITRKIITDKARVVILFLKIVLMVYVLNVLYLADS